jgi:hypothetical protein
VRQLNSLLHISHFSVAEESSEDDEVALPLQATLNQRISQQQTV